jgi:hypothetical protein
MKRYIQKTFSQIFAITFMICGLILVLGSSQAQAFGGTGSTSVVLPSTGGVLGNCRLTVQNSTPIGTQPTSLITIAKGLVRVSRMGYEPGIIIGAEPLFFEKIFEREIAPGCNIDEDDIKIWRSVNTDSATTLPRHEASLMAFEFSYLGQDGKRYRASASLTGQTNTIVEASVIEVPNEPEILVLPNIANGSNISLGNRSIGVPIKRFVSATNDGYQTLIISNLISSDLVNVSFSELKISGGSATREIPPDVTFSFISMEYIPTAAGPFSFRLDVTTNDSDENPTILTFHGVGIDNIDPVITEITPTPTPTKQSDARPYVFNSSEAGTLKRSGLCTTFSLDEPVVEGENTINLSAVSVVGSDVTVSDCSLTVTDASGNESNKLEVPTFRVDAAVPRVEILGAPAETVAPFTAQFKFSEPVNDFIRSDIDVGNGTATNFSGANGNSEFSALITPSGDGVISIGVPANVAKDAVGNDNTAATQVTTTADITKPSVSITAPAAANDAFDVSINFSEPITGFEDSELIVTNGTFARTSVTYGFTPPSIDPVRAGFRKILGTVTPTGNGIVTMNVAANVAQDLFGHDNTAATQASTTIDTEIPILTPPANQTANTDAGEATAAIDVTALGSVSDNVDTGLGITYRIGSTVLTGSHDFPVGETTVTMDAVDSAGNNAAQVSFKVTIGDTEIPILTPPTDQTADTDAGEATAAIDVTSLGSVIDNVDTGLAITYRIGGTVLTGSHDFPVGETIVTMDAVDSAGNNAAQVSFKVTISDVEMPIITAPADQTVVEVSGTGKAALDVTSLGSVSDNADTSLTITYKVGSFVLTGSYDFPLGDTTVTMDAVDAVGNIATQVSFMVSVTDGTPPSVVISTSTESVLGIGSFDVSVAFSENVIGFEDTDISVTNGNVTAFSGADDSYSATITTTGTGTTEVSIVANMAQDGAGNGNLASNTISVVNAAVEETQKIIAEFQNNRANQLIANQPDLIGFLSGAGGGEFSAEVTKGVGSFDLATDPSKPIWLRLSGSRTEHDTTNGSYLFGAMGSHREVAPNVLVGAMLQFDYIAEQDGIADIKGNGWLIGPYFTAKLHDQDLFLEGRLLYGQTANEITPFGTYTDDFDTERWLAQIKVAGELDYGATTLRPSLQFSYTTDEQLAYVDTFSNLIPSQRIELAQLAFGLEFNHFVSLADSSNTLELTGGISAIGSSTSGTGTAATVVPSYTGGRARAKLGTHYSLANGGVFSISAYLDGIGTNGYHSYGGDIGFSLAF